METFECIEKRRSIRSFSDTPLEWEKVGNILRAAQLAPSAGNAQDVRIVVVTDKDIRDKIAESCMKQFWIATAPVILIVYSDPRHTKRLFGLRGDKLYSIQNSSATIQNILLAATDLGLASCWVGAFDENMLNTVLGAPSIVRPQAVIPIGYSDESPDIPKKYEIADTTFINGWGSKIVNIDLVFDDFSDALKKKVIQAKELAEKEGPKFGKNLIEKSKKSITKIQEKIRDKAEERKKQREKALEKELGEEEAVLEDTDEKI